MSVRISPFLNRSSASTLTSRESDPWWTSTSPRGKIWWPRASAVTRVLTKTRVEPGASRHLSTARVWAGEVFSGKPDADVKVNLRPTPRQAQTAGPPQRNRPISSGFPDGRREPDPLELPSVGGKPFERHRELGSPFAVCEFVDLVDDDVSDILQVPRGGACP